MFLSLEFLFLWNCSKKTISKRGEKFLIKSAHKTDQLIALSTNVYVCMCECFFLCSKLIYYLKLGRKFYSYCLIHLLIEKRSMDGIEKFFFLLASNDLELIVSGDVCVCVRVCF